MTNQEDTAGAEALTASLVAAGSADSMPDGLYLSDDRYVDWSMRLADGTRVLELGHLDGDAVNIEISVAELRQVHAQLTATLVAEWGREASAEAADDDDDADDEADGI